MRHNWAFGGVLAALYLWFSWLLQSTSKMLDPSSERNRSFLEQVSGFDFFDVGSLLEAFVRVAAHGPGLAITTLCIVGALIAFASTNTSRLRHVIGGLHGLTHVMVALASMSLLARLNLNWLGLDPDGPLQVSLFVLEMFAVGGFAGSLVMGLYLFITDRWFGMHLNEVFSVQSIPDFKNFLRMHIDTEGDLTIYPIGVRRVLREDEWQETDNASAAATLTSEPWWVPKNPSGFRVEPLGTEIRIPGPKRASSHKGSTHG